MNTLNENLCPACLSTNNTFNGRKNDYDIWQCLTCKTLYVCSETLSKKITDEIQNIYAHYYDSACFTISSSVANSLQKLVNTFVHTYQTGKILDIGYGEGALLSIAERNGWKCYGVELSPQSLRYGSDQGWTVTSNTLTDSRFDAETFDIVTMIEFIEHVPEPDSFLKETKRLLRPGGILYLTTPNAKSINKRWLGLNWSVVSPPEHITIWSVEGLVFALERNGFQIKKIQTEGFNPFEIISSLNFSKKKKTVNRNESGFALNESFTSSSWRRLIKSWINYGLSFFRLGDGVKILAEKKDSGI
jgi:ubiquinone/menaquinone biosynthesis C-methylase UbiE